MQEGIIGPKDKIVNSVKYCTESRFEEEMTSKWLHLFEGSGVPYGPINNMKNVFAEPQVCFLKLCGTAPLAPVAQLSMCAVPAQLLVQLKIDLGEVQGLEHGTGSETLMK
ncbi:hypothetical protein J1605_013364 [Eschrichtius robustus]|uniref:Uncharacterized protein n=1 Tax=Eschrichtius robustus TaxID=9764 RepID=A0AB34GI11_ESCRO|nr:hypothetical protein J1605_013364 [Eschrichtius robustus]